MRIVLINQHYIPDTAPTGRLLADVGSSLASEGHDVVVVCSRHSYAGADRNLPRQETCDGVAVRRVGGTSFSRRWRVARVANYLTFFLFAALDLARIKEVDVFVCLSTPPLLATIVEWFARRRAARFVFWVMDIYPEIAFALGYLSRASLTARILQSSARSALERADEVIALGETMRLHLEPANKRTTVVHNWGDGHAIVPTPVEGHPLRTAWGWDDKFVVLYSGNLGLPHEFDTALEAVDLLRDDPGILMAFVGEGPRTKETKARVMALGLQNVEFRPRVPEEDLAELLTAPDLHLVTLREEVTGLCVPSRTYNILAAGKPVLFVGSDDCEVAQIIKHLECGFHARVGDPESLTAVLQLYRDNPGLLKEHGRNAREGFERRFTQALGVGAVGQIVKAAP